MKKEEIVMGTILLILGGINVAIDVGAVIWLWLSD
jgi:hypothetical protein